LLEISTALLPTSSNLSSSNSALSESKLQVVSLVVLVCQGFWERLETTIRCV
jgi:hypothetical protein